MGSRVWFGLIWLEIEFLTSSKQAGGHTWHLGGEGDLVVMTSHGDGFDGIVLHKAFAHHQPNCWPEKNNMWLCFSSVWFWIFYDDCSSAMMPKLARGFSSVGKLELELAFCLSFRRRRTFDRGDMYPHCYCGHFVSMWDIFLLMQIWPHGFIVWMQWHFLLQLIQVSHTQPIIPVLKVHFCLQIWNGDIFGKPRITLGGE